MPDRTPRRGHQSTRPGILLASLGVSLSIGLVGVSDRLDRLARGAERHAGFRLLTPSGSPSIGTGEPLTLAAVCSPHHPDTPLPTAAELHLRRPDATHMVPMEAVHPGAFVGRVPDDWLTAPFDYRVRVGAVESAWHRVAVGERACLADYTLTVMPPPGCQHPPWRATSPETPIEALAGSRATLQFTMTAPATVEVVLQTRSGDRVPVEVAPPGTGHRAEFLIPQDATLTLTLATPGGPTSRHAVPLATVPDQVPTLEPATPLPPLPWRVRPGDLVRFPLSARDDGGPPAVTLEIEGRPAESLAVHDGTAEVTLPADAEPGQAVHARVVARESSPAARAVTLPADGWWELTADPLAIPFAEQRAFAESTATEARLTHDRDRLRACLTLLRRAATDPDGGEIRPEANATLQSLALQLDAVEPDAARPVRRAAEADGSRHALVQEATALAHARLADVDRSLDRLPGQTALRRAAAVLESFARELDRTPLPAGQVARRLEGLTATHAGLRVAADADRRQSLGVALQTLAALKAELTALESAERTLPARRQAVAAALPLAGQRRIAHDIATLFGGRRHALRLAGVAPVGALAADAAGQLEAGRLLDSAVVQETLAGALDRLATRCDELAEARVCRRESLKQLLAWQARWATDPPDAAERAALADAASTLGTTPEQLADAHRATPPREETLKHLRRELETILQQFAQKGTLDRLDALLADHASTWPTPAEALRLAVGHARASDHPGIRQFARLRLVEFLDSWADPGDTLPEAVRRLAAAEGPDRAGRLAAVRARLEPARAVWPATVDSLRQSLAERDPDAGLREFLRLYDGTEPAALTTARLARLRDESRADPKTLRLIDEELTLVPPGGHAGFVGPPSPRDGDRLPRLAPEYLPGPTLAETLRDLARHQREVRDATTKALADALKPLPNNPADPLSAESDRLTAQASAPDADRAGLLAAARRARAGDADGLAGSPAPMFADCWTRTQARRQSLSAELAGPLADLPADAQELMADAAGWVASGKPDSLAEAGFRLDAARAVVAERHQSLAPTDNGELIAAGRAVRRLTGAASPGELRDAAAGLTGAARVE